MEMFLFQVLSRVRCHLPWKHSAIIVMGDLLCILTYLKQPLELFYRLSFESACCNFILLLPHCYMMPCTLIYRDYIVWWLYLSPCVHIVLLLFSINLVKDDKAHLGENVTAVSLFALTTIQAFSLVGQIPGSPALLSRSGGLESC